MCLIPDKDKTKLEFGKSQEKFTPTWRAAKKQDVWEPFKARHDEISRAMLAEIRDQEVRDLVSKSMSIKLMKQYPMEMDVIICENKAAEIAWDYE